MPAVIKMVESLIEVKTLLFMLYFSLAHANAIQKRQPLYVFFAAQSDKPPTGLHA